jgi:hypothetical protein
MPSQYIPPRTTRTISDPNLLHVYPKRCKTVTFQRSFFSRTCRIWNQLPDEMRRKDKTLLRFRGMLKQFYHTAACTIFNSDDPRTWKSVCPKCKSARILSNTLSCCNWDIFAYRAHCNCLYQLLLFYPATYRSSMFFIFDVDYIFNVAK